MDSINNFFAGDYLVHNEEVTYTGHCRDFAACTVSGLCGYDCDAGYTYYSSLNKCCVCDPADSCCDSSSCTPINEGTSCDGSACKTCQSGTCTVVDDGTFCGNCKKCSSGECTEPILTGDPHDDCDTTGCLTGDCKDGACDYYTLPDKHNCGVDNRCNNSGQCTYVGPLVSESGNIVLDDFSSQGIDSLIFGYHDDVQKSEIIGSEGVDIGNESKVTIKGNIQLNEGSYLVHGSETNHNLVLESGHIILNGGAIVRAGGEIKSGPAGSDALGGPGNGKTACICMKNGGNNYCDTTEYDTGFLPTDTGQYPCSGVNCEDGYIRIGDCNWGPQL